MYVQVAGWQRERAPVDRHLDHGVFSIVDINEVDFAAMESDLHVLTYVASFWAMLVCPEPSDTSVSIK